MKINEQIITVDGRKVHYCDAGETNPRSMILLHGEFGNAHSNWETSLPALAEQYYVIAPDWPGFGRSDPIPAATLADWINWLQRLLETLNIKQTILIGASFGAMLARLFAGQAPKYVATLILVDGGILSGATGCAQTLAKLPVGAWLFRRLANRTLARASLQKLFHNPAALTPELAQQMAAEAGGLTGVMQLLATSPVPEPKGLWTNTLILWGDQDQLTPPEIGRRLRQILPDATWIVLADCGHFPHIEGTEVFTTQALYYLEQLDRPRRGPGVAPLTTNPKHSR